MRYLSANPVIRHAQHAALLAVLAILSACGGGGGAGQASGQADPVLAAQIEGLKPADSSVVPVFVELSSNAPLAAADTALDAAAQRRQVQQQFIADLVKAAAQPLGAATGPSGCDMAELSVRLGNAFSPQTGAAVRVELSACELDLLPKIKGVKGVHADIPLSHSASADATALALEVQRSFDGQGNAAAIADGTTTAWPTPAKGGKADGIGHVVAVLDTGVEERHPALGGSPVPNNPKVLPGACFSTHSANNQGLCPNGKNSDTRSLNAGRSCADSAVWGGDRAAAIAAGCFHGTSMAGVAAMDYSRTSGVPSHGGAAKGARILPIQVFSKVVGSKSVSSSASDLLAAIEWLVSQADTLKAQGQPIVALNMSLGGGSYAQACDQEFVGGLFKTAFANLRQKGIVPVVAAGNSGNKNAIAFPACVSNTLSVAAAKLGYSGVASYSNFSPQVKLFAPGGDTEGSYAMPTLCSSSELDCWSRNAGTSPATAFVSGAIAALRTAVPQASLDEIESSLTSDLSTSHPSLAKNLSVSGISRPALRTTGSAFKLLKLADPGIAPSLPPTSATEHAQCASGNNGVIVCDGVGSSPTRLSLYQVCVYPKVAYEGDASCTFWDGMSPNVYGFYGPVRSLRVVPAWLNLPALDMRYGEPVLSEGTFVAALSPMSGQKVVSVGKSSPDLSARLPANALVRQISLSTPA